MPMRSGGQYVAKASPMIQLRGWCSFFFSTPMTTGCPSLIERVSPGPATIRLMKFWLDSSLVGFGHGGQGAGSFRVASLPG
jgi:hypothetical protein